MHDEQITTQKFIIKFFPEIMVKGPSAKKQMVGQLYNNLLKLLHKISSEINVRKFNLLIKYFGAYLFDQPNH